MKQFDYVVIGSGCSGAMAAQTLVEAGKQVVMLDVGETNPDYRAAVPDKDYLSLRASDPEQYKYLVGENAQGVALNELGKGAQLTPPRAYMTRHVDDYIPMRSDTFASIESLGYGGLGIGWGLQCWQFSPKELSEAGMDVGRMQAAYETVSKRIGISATNDAAAPYTLGSLQTYQKSPAMDPNIARIYGKYTANKSYFDKHGVRIGRTPLALITEDKDSRKAYAYRDMDFYDDNGESAWRPWETINQLRKRPNFTYINNFLTTRFDDQADGVDIYGIDTVTKKPVTYRCKQLVLACGALGTARIALRSLGGSSGTRLPFLCNPYTYAPCLQPAFFGKAAAPRKIGFGQLSVFLEDEADSADTSITTLYSYQSLMLLRIIRQAPLNFDDARIIMQYLSSGLIITGIQHSDRPTPDKYLQLVEDGHSLTGDALQAEYRLSADELRGQKQRENRYIRALRKTGVYAIKRLNPGHGSSVHYAGTLPFSVADQPLTLNPSGRIHGTDNVYVADSSGFKFLPARGLTFSILANAHLTAENVLQHGK